MMSRERSVPILTYHQISCDSTSAQRHYTVTPQAFAAQMAWLGRLGCRTVLLDDIVAALEGKATLPDRAVAITFDDGFRDAVREAAPVLARHGFRATFYVVAGLIGRTSEWLRREPTGAVPLADAAALRELEMAGCRCESHSVTHPRLAGLELPALRRELVDSRTRLEDVLGRSVRHIAYPHGDNDAIVRAAAAEAGYLSGVTTARARARVTDHRYALPRIPVSGRDAMLDFMVRLRLGRSARELILDRGRARIRRMLPG